MVQTCSQCNQAFEITEDDLAFYEKVSPVFGGKKELIPPPTLCPECREQRRMAWRNERKWYNCNCDGCKKDIVAVYQLGSPYLVYCRICWWSQEFDPLKYGKEFDFSKTFYQQFSELEKSVPHLSLMNDDGVQSENCEYTQDFSFGKNCYIVIGSWNVRDSMYSDTACQQAADVMDCDYIYGSQYIYECQYSQKLYNCQYLRNCDSCSDCVFGFDLRGCRNCFGCVGLRQREYCIFNKQYTKEEYQKIIGGINLGSHTAAETFKDKFAQLLLTVPHRNLFLNNCENSQGDNLLNCKDSFGYDLYDAQNCQYFTRSDGGQYCYDIYHSGNPQWCLEGLTPDDSYMSCFVQWTWKCKNVFYSDNCHSSEYLFGCVGLKRPKYCILNKQYTKEEYEELVPRIIEQMRQSYSFPFAKGKVAESRMESDSTPNPSLLEGRGGENIVWGEFFPPSLSPFGYNETVAMEYYPLTKEQALEKGFNWSDYVSPPPQVDKIIKASQLPDSIDQTPDDILNWAIECEVTGKPYKIIKQELKFYRDHHLPIPRRHPDQRHLDRMKLRNPRKLFNRQCAKCSQPIQTTYAPERPEKVYCEKCYLKEVY